MKRYTYILLPVLFLLIAGFAVMRYKKKEKEELASFYPLKARASNASLSSEWISVKKQFDDLMKIIGTNPDDVKSRIALASLYIKEARVTGNYMYYDMAAMKYVNQVLEKEPENFEALIFKSLLYLSQHHFADGLAMAEKAKQINPYNAFVYGILVDANVEMGNYKEAIADADKMISIRPDMRSYSRISYLREIHGDFPGAIEAMKLAVEAGMPGDESTEWSRVQLGQLYEKAGDLKSAEMNYLLSLHHRPGYAYAIAGQARIAVANEEYDRAIALYQQADTLINDYSFKEQLVEIYKETGQKDKADELNDWLLASMNKDAESGKNNDNIGHYADRELAYVYLNADEYSKALEHALAEYNRRPGNIDANETLAWVYYKKNEVAKAIPYLDTALKTNSRNPVLLCHAGLVYAKAGEKSKAKQFLSDATGTGYRFPETLKNEVALIL